MADDGHRSMIARNGFWLLVSQLLTWSISVVMVVVVPDRLGANDFGLYSFVFAYVGFFAFVGSLGTSQLLTREIARDPDLFGPWCFNALVMKLALATGLSIAALGLGAALGFPRRTMALVVVLLVWMYCSMLNEVAVGSLSGLNRIARPAAWGVIQMYVSAALGLAVVLSGHGVVWYSMTPVVGLAVAMTANLWYVRQFVPKASRSVDVRLWRRMARSGFPLLILSGLILLYGTIDVPLLEWLTDSSAVGRYSLAYRWVGIPVFIATVVVGASMAPLSAYAKEASNRFAELANRSLRIVIGVAVPAAAGTIIIAFDLIHLLYRNGDFDDSAVLIRILAVHIPLATISTVLGATLIASDRQRRYVYVALIAAVTNPPVTAVLIIVTRSAFNNGAIGAAIGTVLTELYMVSGAIRIRPKGTFDRATTGFTARCILASAIMAVPLVTAFDHLGLVVKVAAGIVLYLISSFALRTLRPSDLRVALDVARNSRRYVAATTEPDDGLADAVDQTEGPGER